MAAGLREQSDAASCVQKAVRARNPVAHDLVFRIFTYLQVFKMHIVRESAGAADDAVHHLLVVAERPMRHPEIHQDLAVALGTVATVSGFTHHVRLVSSNDFELT